MASQSLESTARTIRTDIIEMISEAGSGHPGGSLSCADILTALYFGEVLNHDSADPRSPERDRFILAKGHAAPALYATLANAGYLPREELKSLRKLGSRLQGHPDSNLLPAIEVSTGSLGQGLSISAGVACGLRLQDSGAFVFTLLGDGECEEGQVWEAAMFAAHQGLDHLIAIIDNNNLQIDGKCTEVCSPEDLGSKFEAFGWKVYTVDGHDIPQLIDVLSEAKASTGAPKVIIAKTTKGKGVSFMEDNVSWHGKAPNAEETVQALEELAG